MMAVVIAGAQRVKQKFHTSKYRSHPLPTPNEMITVPLGLRENLY